MAARRITAVANALRVLDALGQSPEGLRLKDVGLVCGLGPSTTHLLLATLVEADYVESPEPGLYRLSFAAYALSAGASDPESIAERLTDYLHMLAHVSGEAASLAVRRGASVKIVQRVESNRVLRADIQVGTSMPLHASASGKVFLAFTDVVELDRLSRTQTTTHGDAVDWSHAAIDAVRSLQTAGHTTNQDEYVEHVSACAAPVLDAAGHLVAAVSLAGPTARFDARSWGQQVKDAAQQMSKALHRTPPAPR